MIGTKIDPAALTLAAARRGLSPSGLCIEAGLSRNTLAKIRKGLTVTGSTARKLDEALARLPVLENVVIEGVAS